MATKPEMLSLNFHLSAELVARVDEYRYENRIPSRTEAIRVLLEKALGSQRKKQ